MMKKSIFTMIETLRHIMKTLKFIKIRCSNCKKVSLIPTYGKFLVKNSLNCYHCRKIVLTKISRK